MYRTGSLILLITALGTGLVRMPVAEGEPVQPTDPMHVYFLPLVTHGVPLRTHGQTFTPSVAGYVGTRYGTADGLGSDIVLAVAVDGRGVAWLGTSAGATAVLPDGRVRTYTTARDGLPFDAVEDIAIDRHGDPWVVANLLSSGGHTAGYWGAIGWFNGTSWITWRNLGEFREGQIDVLRALAVDAADSKWIATEPWWFRGYPGGDLEGQGGVYRMRGRTYEDYQVDAWTVADGVSLERTDEVAVDAHGNRWFVAASELVRLAPDDRWYAEGAAQGRPGGWVTAITVDPTTDALWVAAGDLLARRTPDARWQVVAGPDGGRAPASRAVAMAVDPRGNLWYGNYIENPDPSGIRWAAGGWSAFGEADGPIEDSTRDIFAAVDGTVWFGTYDGAVRLSPIH